MCCDIPYAHNKQHTHWTKTKWAGRGAFVLFKKKKKFEQKNGALRGQKNLLMNLLQQKMWENILSHENSFTV